MHSITTNFVDIQLLGYLLNECGLGDEIEMNRNFALDIFKLLVTLGLVRFLPSLT